MPLLFALPLLVGVTLTLATLDLAPAALSIVRGALLALVTGLAYLAACLAISRLARRGPSLSRWVVVVLFLWAALAQLRQFAEHAAHPLGIGLDSLATVLAPELLGIPQQLLLLAGLLLWFFEDERRNLARTAGALALSEERRRRSEHMESVGLRDGGVAHDCNNLLTAVTGHAEILLLRAPPGHPDREDLLPIARAATRAAELVRQLLTFSRRQPLHPRRFALDELLADRRRTFESLLGENVRLELVLGAPAAVLHADPAQIEQAVFNLVSNARDAIRGRGSLRIRTTPARIEAGEAAPEGTALAPGSYVRLEVADDGCGIPPEAKDKIFDPYSTTKPGKGTGLGLSSVHGIVTLSGGEIRVESTPGVGTTFRIWLPLVDAAPESRVELVPAAPGVGGAETLLLVEDEDQVRLLAQRLLARAGYRVVVARGGDEAREQLRAHPRGFQLLLSDVVMPGLPLEELLGTGRREYPELRVLLMSGYSESSVGRQGVDVAAENFLQKPFTSVELLGAVRSVLDAPVAARPRAVR